MDDDPIPDDVRRLVERHFTSVSEMEALLVLVRDRRIWPPLQLARALVINEEYARALLATLESTRLVKADGDGFVFAPAKERDRSAAESLAGLYDTYRLRIMNIVFSKPSDSVRDFANAFRLKPRDDDDDAGRG